ncbi:MAG TPA: hypothetical protein VJU81_08700 [Methylomirabilota bacterium]|nr:hypothetical protein [Methylomirabilota bacterium]
MSTPAKVIKVDIFKKDSPRGIDRIIDYFGNSPRGRVLDLFRGGARKTPRLRLLPSSR